MNRFIMHLSLNSGTQVKGHIPRIILPLILLFFVLVGCGGGGGGSSATKIIYQTDWTNQGSGITGVSQRFSVYTTANELVTTRVIEQTTNGIQNEEVALPNSGTFYILIELFSQAGLGGTRTGTIEFLDTISGSKNYKSAVGNTPTSMKVSPQSAAFSVQQGKQFYATAYSSADVMTFVLPADVTWTTLGGVANVNSSGFVQGTSSGNGTVRANHVPTSHQGSGLLNVTPFNATTSKWTVMVFLNAANDLSQFSTLNVNQMEKVAQNSDVRFVVQWKQTTSLPFPAQFNGTRRYLVKPDTNSTIASELIQDLGTNIDMGQPQTMLDFINWTKTFYPADRYVLIVWNHGSGWRRSAIPASTRAVSFDDETGNSIQTWELAQAIGSTHFDIIAWDASLMQMFEVAHELRDLTDYVVGSEESPPGEGYPYDLIFDDFRDNPDASTLNLSKAFVDGMVTNPLYVNRKITQSVIQTNKLDALVTSTSTLANELVSNAGSISGVMTLVRNNSQKFLSGAADVFYRDLYDMCLQIEANIGINSIITASADVRAKILDAVVWEGHNANSPNSHGISIFYPTASVFGPLATDYANLRFAQQSTWDAWLAIAP